MLIVEQERNQQILLKKNNNGVVKPDKNFNKNKLLLKIKKLKEENKTLRKENEELNQKLQDNEEKIKLELQIKISDAFYEKTQILPYEFKKTYYCSIGSIDLSSFSLLFKNVFNIKRFIVL